MAFVVVLAGAWPIGSVASARAATPAGVQQAAAPDPAATSSAVPAWPGAVTDALDGRGGTSANEATRARRLRVQDAWWAPTARRSCPASACPRHRGCRIPDTPGHIRPETPRAWTARSRTSTARGAGSSVHPAPGRNRDAHLDRKADPYHGEVGAAAATYTISGRITDVASVPIPDIQVDASGVDSWNNATTAADGTFSIDVTPNTYLISFYDWSQTYANGWYGSGGFQLADTAATPVTITTASVANINAKLPLNYHVSGTITAAGSGTPLPDINVTVASGSCRSPRRPGATAPIRSASRPAPTRSRSSIRRSSTPPAIGRPVASRGTRPARPHWWSCRQDRHQPAAAQEPEDHGQGHRRRRWDPLSGIDVTAMTSDEWQQVSYATTGLDGSYVLPVPSGTYLVQFLDQATVYATGYYSTAGLTAGKSTASTVTVAAADVTGISVAMPKAVHIKGKLTGPGSIAVAGIYVSANGLNGNNTTESATDGTYSIAVEPGIYQLAVSDYRNQADAYPDGFYGTSGFTLDPGASAGIIVTTADVTVNLAMPKMVLVKGKVTGPGGIAVAGITVMSSARMSSSEATTAADGTYSLPVPANGNWSIQYYDLLASTRAASTRRRASRAIRTRQRRSRSAPRPSPGSMSSCRRTCSSAARSPGRAARGSRRSTSTPGPWATVSRPRPRQTGRTRSASPPAPTRSPSGMGAASTRPATTERPASRSTRPNRSLSAPPASPASACRCRP